MLRRLILTIVFLMIVPDVWAVEVLVIGTAENITGHEVGMRNTILSESGLAAANVMICYTGTENAAGHDPSIHIRVSGSWPDACIDYAAANNYELVSISYTSFSEYRDGYIADAFRTNSIGAVWATTADISAPELFYTTTPGQEYPDDTAGSTASNYLEFMTYDSGSLSSATARTAGIIAYLMDNTAFNYWDARAAIRENSSQWNTWDKNIGFGYVNITAAKAETDANVLNLQPPIVNSISVAYSTQADITILFEHFKQTRWDSTKIVYFNSEPAPTAGPADAAGTICDVTNAETTSCVWENVLVGTYYIAAYTESGANYSALVGGFITAGTSVVEQTPNPQAGGLSFFDYSLNKWTQYSDIAALDAVENPTNNDIVDGGGKEIGALNKTSWDSTSANEPIILQNFIITTTGQYSIQPGDNWTIKNGVMPSGDRGIFITAASGKTYTIENVTIKTDATGTPLRAIDNATGAHTINIKNAILVGTTTDLYCSAGSTCTIYNSIYDTTEGSGTVVDGGGNMVADPLFVSSTDFRLRANSPAIRAGTGTLWNGQPCSIGAYQQSIGVVGGGTFFKNYPLGSELNKCTTP